MLLHKIMNALCIATIRKAELVQEKLLVINFNFFLFEMLQL